MARREGRSDFLELTARNHAQFGRLQLFAAGITVESCGTSGDRGTVSSVYARRGQKVTYRVPYELAGDTDA